MARWYSKRNKARLSKVKRWTRYCGSVWNDYATPICNRVHGQCYCCYSDQQAENLRK